MRQPLLVVFAIHILCIIHSIAAKYCLPSSTFEYQDQLDGDRKKVTVSGNQLVITPSGSTERLSIQLITLRLRDDCRTHVVARRYAYLCRIMIVWFV